MSVTIPKNETEFCSCYTHPFSEDEGGFIYCRAVMKKLPADDLICPDCPLMMYDAEHRKYFGCYYFDTDPSEAQSDEERIEMAVEEGRLPRFPYFEETNRHLVEEALQFAAQVHYGQYRKGGVIPYVSHAIEVSGLVHKMTDEAHVIAAAALHDVVEDTEVTLKELTERFGPDVTHIVEYVTEDKRKELPAHETWKQRKTEAIASYASAPHDAKRIALADKVSNLRASAKDHAVLGDKMWEKFNQKDRELQKWYYLSVLDVLKELSGNEVYKEYQSLMKEVFPS